MSAQPDLFGGGLPEGWLYRDDVITPEEEAALLALLRTWPLAPAQYKGYTARREVLSFGGQFDHDTNTLRSGPAVPAALHGLRSRVAALAGLPSASFDQALVARYAPGTPLGWHRDVPDFEVVAGVSLASKARLRLRPYPPDRTRSADVLDVDLAPRSAYVMRGPARWEWQHGVPPVEAERWSVTFRTRRDASPGRPRPARPSPSS